MLYTHEVKEWDATLGSFFFVTLSVKEALQNAALRLTGTPGAPTAPPEIS